MQKEKKKFLTLHFPGSVLGILASASMLSKSWARGGEAAEELVSCALVELLISSATGWGRTV